MRTIYVTGAAGKVGSCVYEGLRLSGRYRVLGGDIAANPAQQIDFLDVTDYEACRRAFEGVDTVIHLAFHMSQTDLAGAFGVNYMGVYNVFEAAKQCGVKRVIFGSSNHTVGRYKAEEKVTEATMYRPSSLYGLSKCHGELLGRLYADKFGLSFINVRIGTFSPTPPKSVRQLKTWLSSRDAVHLMECCIEADPAIDYLTLFAISANRDRYWDIDHLEGLIGYKPQDNGAIYLEQLLKEGEPDPDELVYQGGFMAYRNTL